MLPGIRVAIRKFAVAVSAAVTAAVLSTGAAASTIETTATFVPLIVAGDPTATPPDSPANRIDANTTASPFAGVGSVVSGAGSCTGTLISARHVLTAAHCFDGNGDGAIDGSVGTVTFNLNYGGDLTHRISQSALDLNPEYLGTSTSIRHDLAIITLAEDAPLGVPIYDLAPLVFNDELTLVGYGRSGTGTSSSYSIGYDPAIKRVGMNVNDGFMVDMFVFDFDDPSSAGLTGGSLGNDVETIIGPGDSGGPAFVSDGLNFFLAGVNTFRSGTAPAFGSIAGGVPVLPYQSWIDEILSMSVETAAVPAPGIATIFAAGALAVGRRRAGKSLQKRR